MRELEVELSAVCFDPSWPGLSQGFPVREPTCEGSKIRRVVEIFGLKIGDIYVCSIVFEEYSLGICVTPRTASQNVGLHSH